MPHDRRQSPRCKCAGVSTLYLPGEQASARARVVNLSTGGCLLAFHQPLPLQTEAMVEIAFEVNQLPFRVRAQVGFHFPALSRRVELQLEDLLDELQENHQHHAATLRARAARRLACP